MTECHCTDAPKQSSEVTRMLELTHWLKDTVKCHPMCALRLAIKIVDQEFGYQHMELNSKCPAFPDGRVCDDMARAAYQTKPKAKA